MVGVWAAVCREGNLMMHLIWCVFNNALRRYKFPSVFSDIKYQTPHEMNIITQFARIQTSQTQGNSGGQRSPHSYFDDFSVRESKFNMQMGNDKKRLLVTGWQGGRRHLRVKRLAVIFRFFLVNFH